MGKLHLWPHRKLYGFDSANWSDGPSHGGDYQRFLDRELPGVPNQALAHGANVNGWMSRPWHLDERLHFTNWCGDMALDFLERRDPTVPYFLKVSFHQPHQPCTPPRDYYERYMDLDLPEPYVADWARVYDEPQLGQPVCSWRTYLTPEQNRQYRAGYFGCINHIDDQVGRILLAAGPNTIVVFVSDHGEMLGDHQWIRKRSAFEPSARVPFLIRFPRSMDVPQGQVRAEPVQLMDVMPTLLDAVGAEVPQTVQGRSVLPLLRGEGDWRDACHGECAEVPSLDSGMQYLCDGRMKYIWYPGSGQEQLFDVEDDPREMNDLSARRADQLPAWRQRLVEILADRPEGFVRDGKLATVGDRTPSCLPGWEWNARKAELPRR